VVDTEDLIFLPVWSECVAELSRRAKVLAKWLLDDDPGNAILWVVVLLQVLRDRNEYRRWQSHVENAVGGFLALLKLLQMLLEFLEALVLVVLPAHIACRFAEFFQLLLEFLGGSLDV